jgi:hypothetical protein
LFREQLDRLVDDFLQKVKEIRVLEQGMAHLLVTTPYAHLLALPGICIVSAADLTSELGPIEHYANSGNSGRFSGKSHAKTLAMAKVLLGENVRPSGSGLADHAMNAPDGRKGSRGQDAKQALLFLNLLGTQNAQGLEPVTDLVVKHQQVLNHQLVRTAFGPAPSHEVESGAFQSLGQTRSDIW